MSCGRTQDSRLANTVIPRACGVSSTPRLLGSIIDASGILDRPLEPVIGRHVAPLPPRSGGGGGGGGGGGRAGAAYSEAAVPADSPPTPNPSPPRARARGGREGSSPCIASQ